MSLERANYLVGVRKNQDGTLDYSRAAKMANPQESLFEDKAIGNLLNRMSHETQLGRSAIVGQLAKEKGKTKEEIWTALKQVAKERILFPEKVYHYHSTSLENFASILQTGALLSRAKVKEMNPEMRTTTWSASDDVMMTRDRYDQQGNLVQPGITPFKVGASGDGVTLVMNKNVMALDNYDATSHYPTVTNAPIASSCEAILVENDAEIPAVANLLRLNNLPIPIYKKSDWLSTRS